MFKEVLASIEGIELVPIILLFSFIAFFVAMIFWVYKMDDNAVKEYASLPLENSNSPLKEGE